MNELNKEWMRNIKWEKFSKNWELRTILYILKVLIKNQFNY